MAMFLSPTSGDVAKMKRDILSTLYHHAEDHSSCPFGPTLWCIVHSKCP